MLTQQQLKHLSKVKFTPGMIVRIKLTNFVTYDSIELHVYPKLNIILGPNGTGKSTFLCAVVLGLGGKPSFIGRSPNASDYIKRDRDHAVTELELFNGEGRNHVITRKIISDNSSSWSLQGKVVPFKTIEELLAKYNIIVNNLCQILPQDRVQDFAKMDKKQLLEATQKAVVKGELFNWFQKLKSFRMQLLSGGEDLAELRKKFDSESQKLRSMESEVSSYKEKQSIQTKIGYMQKKEAWLQYEAKNEERAQLNNHLQKLDKAYNSAKNKAKPFLKAIAAQESIEEDLTHKIRNKEMIIQEKNQKIKNFVKLSMQAKGRIASLNEELDATLRTYEERFDNIKALQNKRQDYANNMPTQSEGTITTSIYIADRQINESNRELATLKSTEGDIEYRRRQVLQAINANEHKLAQATSVREKKLELLLRYKDAYEAYKWLNENRGEFSQNIYGPMFLELDVVSVNDAKYVERMIPQADLIAFVCENNKDMTKLLSIMKGQKNLRINAVVAVPQEMPARQRFVSRDIEQLRQFGFTNYLIDLVDGPDPIMHYLCKNYHLHLIPVGTEAVNNNMDSIPKNLPRYFSADTFYKVTTSRFSDGVTRNLENVNEARLLKMSVNVELINAIERELVEKRQQMKRVELEASQLSENKQKVEVENNQAKNKKRELVRLLEHLKSCTVRLRLVDEEIEQLEQISIDPAEEKANTAAKVKKCIEELMSYESKILEIMTELSEARADLGVKKDEVEIVAWRICESQKEAEQKQLEERWAKETLEAAQEVLSRTRAETKDLLNKAKASTDGLSIDDPQFAVRFKTEFQKFSNSLTELGDQICEEQARFRCLQDSGSSTIVAQYEERKRLLDKLEKTLSQKTSHRSTLYQQLLEVREKWLPAMNALLGTINNKFEKCFEYLGCCGTVELDLSEDPDAVEHYGLNIKVKFRNEGSLQALDPFTQSGGERSLSTAIFLLSLQSVITVPFRFVDEINQGMDAYNEVRVYYLIMCAVSQEKSAQYFLITPKLIEDTKISLDCAVHIIYSGKYLPSNDSSSRAVKWSKEKYFKRIGLHQ